MHENDNEVLLKELQECVLFALVLSGNRHTFEVQITRSELYFLERDNTPQNLYQELLEEIRSHYRIWLAKEPVTIRVTQQPAMAKIVGLKWFRGKEGFHQYLFESFLAPAIEERQDDVRAG